MAEALSLFFAFERGEEGTQRDFSILLLFLWVDDNQSTRFNLQSNLPTSSREISRFQLPSPHTRLLDKLT